MSEASTATVDEALKLVLDKYIRHTAEFFREQATEQGHTTAEALLEALGAQLPGLVRYHAEDKPFGLVTYLFFAGAALRLLAQRRTFRSVGECVDVLEREARAEAVRLVKQGMIGIAMKRAS